MLDKALRGKLAILLSELYKEFLPGDNNIRRNSGSKYSRAFFSCLLNNNIGRFFQFLDNPSASHSVD